MDVEQIKSRIKFLLDSDPSTLSDFDREAREFLIDQMEGPEPKKLPPGHPAFPILKRNEKVGKIFIASTAETFDRNNHKALWDEWTK